MTTPFSSVALNRLWYGVLLGILMAFLGFLAYMHVVFTSTLIGDAPSGEPLDPLIVLQSKKFEAAAGRFETRKNLPDVPTDVPNPFDAIAR